MPMSREEAIEFLLEHYQNPQYRGHVDNATFTKSGGNPGCSDVVEISAHIADDGHIDEILFDGQGCTISMAAADYVAEIVQGKTLEEIEALTAEQLIDELGREVVMTRPVCATSALYVLKQAVHDHVMQQRINQAN
jgi:nitrogen fixation protein NifU and related proteins